jgi:hypothetical protein
VRYGSADPTLAQVGLNLKRVVETVDQVGQPDHHDQFHDLRFGIEGPQPVEDRRVDGRGPAGDEVGETDGGALLFVEGIAALVKTQIFDLSVGRSRLLRRSNVGAQSVLAGIDAGGFEIGQFFEFDRHLAFRHDRCVKRNEPFQSSREVGHDRKDVGHFADGGMHAVIDFLDARFGLIFDQGLGDTHLSHPFAGNG